MCLYTHTHTDTTKYFIVINCYIFSHTVRCRENYCKLSLNEINFSKNVFNILVLHDYLCMCVYARELFLLTELRKKINNVN